MHPEPREGLSSASRLQVESPSQVKVRAGQLPLRQPTPVQQPLNTAPRRMQVLLAAIFYTHFSIIVLNDTEHLFNNTFGFTWDSRGRDSGSRGSLWSSPAGRGYSQCPACRAGGNGPLVGTVGSGSPAHKVTVVGARRCQYTSPPLGPNLGALE